MNIARSSQSASLRAGFSWTLGGNLAFSACQMLFWMLLAKLTSPEVVGRYALAAAITVPIVMLSTLQLRNVQATDVRREYLFGHYVALRLLTTALAGLVILAVAGIGFHSATAVAIVLVGGTRLADALSDVCYGLFQQHERMDLISTSMVLRGGLMLVMQAIGLLAWGSLLLGLGLVVGAWLAVFFTYDVRHAIRLGGGSASAARPVWDRRMLLRLTHLTAPLGAMRIFIALSTYLPRLVIERYLGLAVLGLFAAISSLSVATGLVANAMGQTMLPRLSVYLGQGNRAAFLQLVGKTLAAGCGLGVMAVAVIGLWGRPLLAFLFTAEYAAHVDAFLVAMVAATLAAIGTLLNSANMAARHYAALTALYAGVVLVCVVSCAVLIPGGNLIRAAAVVAITNGFIAIGSLVLAVGVRGHRTVEGSGAELLP